MLVIGWHTDAWPSYQVLLPYRRLNYKPVCRVAGLL